MQKQYIKGLNAYEYQHPFDRKALVMLRNTKGLSIVIKKVSEFGIEAFTRLSLAGSGLKVTDSNFPVVDELLKEACRILDIQQVPELYIVRGEFYNATVGLEKPLVAISGDMVNAFNEEELLFVLGYSLSYIKSESVMYQQMAYGLNFIAEIGTTGPLSLITLPVTAAIKRWEKMARYTADRAGLLCCQDADVAASVLIKCAGQPEKMYGQIDVDGFKRQAYEFEEMDLNNYSKIVKLIQSMQETHPPYVVRGAELFKWIKSGECEDIIQRKPVLNLNNREKCSYCGHPTLGDETFCTNCGNKVIHHDEEESQLRCPNCNSPVEEDDKFCMKCGTALNHRSFSNEDFV